MGRVKIEKDTDLLEYLKENSWGTGMIIKDVDTGAEYMIDDISLTMGGQEHLVLELKHIHNDEHWFKTVEQEIKEILKEREQYVEADKTFDQKNPEIFEKHPDLYKKVIKQCDWRIEQLEDILDKYGHSGN